MRGIYSIFAACSLIALTTASCANPNDRTSSMPADEHPTLEAYNRKMFEFNYQVDKYILKPTAKGYRAITTPYIRERVNNALANIKEPISAFNHLLQGEIKESGINLSRLVINSTLGLAGMYDVAGGWGLKPSKAGFDETLAKWCIKDGPFIVLPLLGPATPRSTVGLAVDSLTNPVYLQEQVNRLARSYLKAKLVGMKSLHWFTADNTGLEGGRYHMGIWWRQMPLPAGRKPDAQL